MPLETLLTPEEVADKLRLGLSTVYMHVSKGVIPYLRIGGAIRFRPTQLEKLIEKLSTGTTGE
jgi:excisionase family DNA binding protein